MIDAILKGIAFGLWLAISVGPILFLVIKNSIDLGYKGGMAFIVGVALSDIIMVLTCNLFSHFFSYVLDNKAAIALSGSIFLTLFGIYCLFFKKVTLPLTFTAQQQAATPSMQPPWGLFKYVTTAFTGFAMNILNPGAILFWFVATSTILANAENEPHPIQYRITVFATTLLIVFFTDYLKVHLSQKIRDRVTLKNLQLINRINALLLIGFGVAIYVGANKH